MKEYWTPNPPRRPMTPLKAAIIGAVFALAVVALISNAILFIVRAFADDPQALPSQERTSQASDAQEGTSTQDGGNRPSSLEHTPRGGHKPGNSPVGLSGK